MSKKQSLARYRQHKNAPASYHQYRGDKASALLFQAPTGALLTQKRRQELYGEDATCRLCGLENEDLEHVFYRCPHLQPSDTSRGDLDEVLGLIKNTENLAGNDQPVQPPQWEGRRSATSHDGKSVPGSSVSWAGWAFKNRQNTDRAHLTGHWSEDKPSHPPFPLIGCEARVCV
ncbi:hypothetical protein HPB47_022972 [Ixodes persulcatus]|uniref:Uncharacterized protein n=1 Tax=Ixodes persulcatus TaxID=34615 RepID=A0AC60QAJ6_IXOPE|nr:hypothetical protein HPB47_022972 [Ixodes persulcatus]